MFLPGDGTYDYYAGYDRWEDGSTLPEAMLAVWPASYVNYVPTNDLVLVPKFWRPGRPLESLLKDTAARAILKHAFPGREVVQVHSENINRGGGAMNCITQQQPASEKFVRRCGWSKVKVDAGVATLYARATGQAALGTVPRLLPWGGDVTLERLSSFGDWVRVRVAGPFHRDGDVGWVNEDAIESAGEKCPNAYSPN